MRPAAQSHDLLEGLTLQDKQAILDQELAAFREAAEPDTTELPEDLARVVRYIHDHLFDPALTVRRVKRGCAIRNNNVSTRLRCALGISIRQYIENQRLDAARWLLLRTDLEIFLIGMAVGYVHQETFCRAFHRIYGCPPSETRTGPSGLFALQAVSAT